MVKLAGFLVYGFCFWTSNAQQDPMFTKYMFNTLNYNPAYAGSTEYLSIVAIWREQSFWHF